MYIMRKYSLLFVLTCLLLISCQQDDDSSPNQTPVQTDFTENFGSTFTSNFMGRVVNENNEAIEGVNISVGGMNTVTDINGVFSIQGASVYEKFAYVKASKTGYINGSRSLVPTSGINQVKIMLLAEDVVATVNTGETSEVSLPNGTEVSFTGEFVKSDGSIYSGAVSVIMKHLDPMDDNVEAMMPGMLYAQDTSGDAKVLETYGMVAVELKSTAGEKLQLADGSPAQITLPIPSAGLANAPETIPLWYFDEENGYWKEEGVATLVNGKYVGEVKHFTFWNCDVQLPLVELCINVVDPAGNPIANEFFMLNRVSTPSGWGANAYSWTDENGLACGQVPVNEELVFIMEVAGCNEAFETNIGSFNSDSTITVIVDANYTVVQLTGMFNDCNNNPITDGYIQFNHNDSVHYIPVTNGEINYTYTYCGNIGAEFTAQGIDMGGQQTTTIVSGMLAPTTDLGTITSCGTFEDTDGDGIFDEFEDVNQDNNLENDDTDQDGIPNYNDTDDDNDGVLTADEDINGDGDFTNDDLDGDGVPNYLDATDVNANYAVLNACDDNNDDIAEFNLSSADASVVGNQVDVSISYYLTYQDALDEISPLTSPYNSTSTVLYTRVNYNYVPNYFTIGEMTLNVQNCNAGQPNDLWVCEDQQGIGSTCMVNFDIPYTEILNGNNGEVWFYETQADADANVNPINFSNYCTTSNPQQIFTRADIGGNITVSSFTIYIEPLPTITFSTATCTDGNTTYTAEFTFDMPIDQVSSSAGTVTIDYNTNTITVIGVPISDTLWIDAFSSNCANGAGGSSNAFTAPPNCN